MAIAIGSTSDGRDIKPLWDRDKAEAEFLAGTISPEDEDELRRMTSPLGWCDLIERRERPKRAEFLKDASPMTVLLWIMRSPTIDTRLQADVAIALLPYHHPKIRATVLGPEKPEE